MPFMAAGTGGGGIPPIFCQPKNLKSKNNHIYISIYQLGYG